MNLEQYTKYDGLGLAELVLQGEVSAVELAQLALQAVERVNPDLNAVVETFEDKLESLAEADIPPGPFHGVPFMLKDLGAGEAGRKQEMGSRLVEGYVVPQDSFLTRLFKRAGLVNLGRTTTPEFGHAGTTESVMVGPTRNPWNLNLIAGGSSGGAAAAVSSGIIPVAHASDGGGSIRIPASCCGVVGLNPSRGRTTMGPWLDEAMFGLARQFAVSRTVRDTAAMLDAVGKPCPGDPYILKQPARPYMQELGDPKSGLRIAFTTKPWAPHPVMTEVADATEQIAHKCDQLGHFVTEASPAYQFEEVTEALVSIWAVSFATRTKAFAELVGRPVNPDFLEPVSLAFYEKGQSMSVADLYAALDKFNAIRREVGHFFKDYDLLLTPTLSRTPPLLGHHDQNHENLSAVDFWKRGAEFEQFLALFNITGQPSISLPLSMSPDGLPIGAHFVAESGDESLLINLAAVLENELPWADRIPPVHAAKGVV